MHWLQVRWHAADVRRYIRGFNQIMATEGLAPIGAERLGMGFSPAWIIGAIAMILCSAAWGVPMMLAGAVHWRYARQCSQIQRRQMAMRVRELLLRQRPPMNVPLPVRLREPCANPLCRMTLPKEAAFCPRCGTRAPRPAWGGSIDVGA
jgi:hypothetical protein